MRHGFRLFWLCLVAGLFALGCSDSDAGDPDAGDPVFGTGGTSGTSGAGGAGGTGGINTQTGGTGGGNDMDGGMMTLDCDPNVPTTATCGGVECPAPSDIAARICTVPCCIDDQCGTANTSSQFASECALPPESDDRCPDEDLGGMMVDGCCTDDNRCGIVDTFFTNSCVAREDVPSQIADLEPRDCDEGADAGL